MSEVRGSGRERIQLEETVTEDREENGQSPRMYLQDADLSKVNITCPVRSGSGTVVVSGVSRQGITEGHVNYINNEPRY